MKLYFKSMIVVGALLVSFSSQAKNLKSKKTCPDGYAKVSGNRELGTKAFCVMKYEAKARKQASDSGHATDQVDPLEINVNGCDGTGKDCDGGTSEWGLSDHQPASVKQGIPWRNISRENAIAECQSLGTEFDLISNAEWQTVARNIESQSTNWSGQKVGSGCISQGNISADSICNYTSKGPESGQDPRASHELSNGEKIYHFSGNIWEWVKDDYTQEYKTVYASNLTGPAKIDFGPERNYDANTCNSANRYCGMGFGNFYYGGTGVLRGGSWDNENYAGVFSAILVGNTSYTSDIYGFRCVRH